MTEVFVGVGGQVGLIAGGFLYDVGGLPLPFLACAALQIGFACIGFRFEEETDGSQQNSTTGSQQPVKETIPWKQLITPRLCVGAYAGFATEYSVCFVQAVILPYMAVYLAPVTVGQMSLASSFRPACYLGGSLLLASLMHSELLSCECLVLIGGVLAAIGATMLAPLYFVTGAEALIEGSEPSLTSKWVMIMVGFAFC